MIKAIPSELDSILALLGNTTRRKILERLSQEPNYPLQLAKDLGLGQQLVAKHLQVMEEAGLVSSSMKSSPRGPDRRTYVLRKNVSVIVDVASHHFNAKLLSFNGKFEKELISEDSILIMKRVDELTEYTDDCNTIGNFAMVMDEIDKRIEELEKERIGLLYIRNAAMNESSKILKMVEDPDARRMLHHTIDKHNESVENISKSFKLKENIGASNSSKNQKRV